jgi:quercetin dioxygenase-like cupin family protein
MRRFGVFLSAVGVVIVGIVALSAQPSTVAQEATPSAEEMMPEGLAFEALGYGVAETLPEAPVDLALFRFGLEPGASFQFDPNDPSVALAYVESGEATFTVESPITILRAAGAGTPFPEETEEVAAGMPFTLSAGDSAVFPPNVVGELGNNGTDAVTLLVANIAPLDAMMTDGTTNPGATPTP